MAYVQNGVGYTLKCDKCGTLLHRKEKADNFVVCEKDHGYIPTYIK